MRYGKSMIYLELAVVPGKLEQGWIDKDRERSEHSSVCVLHISEITEAMLQDTVVAEPSELDR